MKAVIALLAAVVGTIVLCNFIGCGGGVRPNGKKKTAHVYAPPYSKPKHPYSPPYNNNQGDATGLQDPEYPAPPVVVVEPPVDDSGDTGATDGGKKKKRDGGEDCDDDQGEDNDDQGENESP